MKEISYIHSEAYAAGELKHGTISLIEDGILVVGVLTQPDLYREDSCLTWLSARAVALTLWDLQTLDSTILKIQQTLRYTFQRQIRIFATSLAVIPLQLLGYYVSVARGLDVDKPRNLAKSVTVE